MYYVCLKYFLLNTVEVECEMSYSAWLLDNAPCQQKIPLDLRTDVSQRSLGTKYYLIEQHKRDLYLKIKIYYLKKNFLIVKIWLKLNVPTTGDEQKELDCFVAQRNSC